MRSVVFEPDALTGGDASRWQAWAARAAAVADEAARLVAGGGAADLTPAERVWREAKALLLELAYAGKCAYCEYDLRAGSFGAADHYRPKSRVRVIGAADTRRVECVAGGAHHPGYWWCAVDWRNIVPACDRCNNHKSDLFPVRRTRAELPDHGTSLEALGIYEDPLLLHPLVDEPERHLTFTDFGGIAERDGSSRGMWTIDICGLDREELDDVRRERQGEARRALELAAIAPGDAAERCRSVYESYTARGQRFSAAVRDYLDRLIESGQILRLSADGS